MANFDQSVLKSLSRNNIVIAADGSITIAEKYTLPIVDGTSGQVLTTDGSGNLTWETP